MSHFPKMFQSGPGSAPGLRTFLVQVNRHGEAVVYALDAAGNPIEMCAGDTSDVLFTPIKMADPAAFLVRIEDPDDPEYYRGWNFNHDTWRDVVAAMNRKAWNSEKGRAIGRYGAFLCLELPIEDYIEYAGDGPRYCLTRKAIDADAAYDAREAAREAGAKVRGDRG